ncbi:hypothetical protein EQG41_20445 [Billgrantia azerbaijanica]|nr:hypothetical protein EQG41_20445 [Halomonas azerbaijanica]
MNYWRDSNGTIYWGDRVHPGDTPVDTATGEAARLQHDRERMVVSPFQGLAALDHFGYLEQVETMMAAPETPRLTRLAFERTQEWRRLSPMMTSMIGALGLTAAQADEMFAYAATVEA